MKFFRLLIFLLCSNFYFTASSQTVLIDSLRKNVYHSRNDEEKLAALLALCEEFQSLNRDSFDVYGPQIKELADKTNNQQSKSLAALAYANWYYRWGWSDSALVFIEPEFQKNDVTDINTRAIYFKLARAKAIYHGSKQRYEEALAVLYKILPEAEKYKDTLNIGLTSNTIGSIAIARNQYQDAISWIRKAIDLSIHNDRYVLVLAPAYVNAGNAYSILGKTDSALYFINKALPLCRKIENLNYLATALRIQSNIYSANKKFDEAEKAMLEMMVVRKKTSPVSQIVEDNLQLASFYANAGQIRKAIEICKNYLIKGDLNKAAEGEVNLFNNDPKVRLDYLQALAAYYKQAGMMADYQASLEELVMAKDSLYAANSAEAIASLQTKYDVQKKENIILQQKYDLQKKNFLFYGSMILTVLLLAIAIALFRNYRKKQRLRMHLMLEEEKIISEQAVKKAEEKERVRIAADLHDNLGAYAASMASNLGYIHLPDVDEKTSTAFKELSNNSSAIISQLNDTIWVLKKEEQGITAVSDRIKSFINRIKKSYPDVHIEVIEEILIDHQLLSSQAFHLYRILQEAINNALKHSRGTNILVKILSNENWTATVQDDGVGINKEMQINKDGNGLSNMKKRATEAGWNIEWQQQTKGGTNIKIYPTTN